MASLIKLTAPAKVNLCLHINGRRDDGYHMLESVIVFTDKGDEITIEKSSTTQLIIQGKFGNNLPNDGSNLMLKAVSLLEKNVGKSLPVTMSLTKNLPIAAGIGGGSSDAASVLKGINRLYELAIDDTMLRELGLELGADVPVCLYGKPAYVSGIGEVIEPYVLPDNFYPYILLANPGVEVATGDIFSRMTKDNYSHMPDDLLQACNDMQAVAAHLVPEIEALLGMLKAIDGVGMVQMSGSGATCFALFRDKDKALDAAHYVTKADPAMWCQVMQVC